LPGGGIAEINTEEGVMQLKGDDMPGWVDAIGGLLG
jgi:hypothetical protein